MKKLVIRLMSDLCVGNGESVGYGIDSDICADHYGFPYIPGRRILGCLREVSEVLKEYGLKTATDDNIRFLYGDADGNEGKLSISNAYFQGIETMHQYITSLMEGGSERDYLVRQSSEDKIIQLYSSVRGQTKIGSNGKAVDGTLRYIRVLNQYNPMTGKQMEFTCLVDDTKLNEQQKSLFESSCLAFRHIGSDRNRGLGNIQVSIQETKEESNSLEIDNKEVLNAVSEQETVELSYMVSLDSPITLQEYMESGSQIKARTVIGFFANEYLKNHGNRADDTFEKLFLDGTVRWSALTPIINDRISQPVPVMLMKLKNQGGKLINSFACSDADWNSKKPKSLDGFYSVLDEKEKTYYVASPEIVTTYHNRIREAENKEKVTGLYMQDALVQGMIYGGSVTLPKYMAEELESLFAVGTIKLGRSKKVQYGTGTIQNVKLEESKVKEIVVEEGEPIFAILKSDLVWQQNGNIDVRNETIREVITAVAGLQNEIPEEYHDICRYHVLSGYHAMWKMQKPKMQAVMGGSIYCFKANEGKILNQITIGEYQQEGMGVIELVPLHYLTEYNKVEKGIIGTKEYQTDIEIEKQMQNKLLYKALLEEMNEYAFRFHKKRQGELKKGKTSETIPCRRLRQMLENSADLSGLWEMVESMKTSDVSSESEGKLKTSKKLLMDFYGADRNHIDLELMIEDKALWEEVRKNDVVKKMVQQDWKEPLFMFLHMTHYQKGGK